MQRQTKQRQTGYLQMSEIQATISRYLRASAGNCNFPTMHTIDCFIGMIQTGEATMDDMQTIGGEYLTKQLTERATEKGWELKHEQ